jgi:hypothetical protein
VILINLTVPIQLTNNDVRVVSFQVVADILNNGSYTLDLTEDVESVDITNDLSLKQGGSIIGKPSTNVASITLLNPTGRYSPNNPNNVESEYEPDGIFRNNTKVKIYAGFIDQDEVPQTRCLFDGVIVKFDGKYGENKMTLGLKDYAKFLMKKKNPNRSVVDDVTYDAVLFNASISDALDYLIDYALGTSFSRVIQSMPEKLPVVEFPIEQSVWQTIQNLCQACDGFAYFEDGVFKFSSPLSPDWTYPNESQYNFVADNLYRFTESVDEDSIINKFKITSNCKTLQMRQILVGNFDTNVVSMVDDYNSSDSKNALNIDGVTLTLKSQADDLTWIDSLNLPLVQLSNQPQSLDELAVVNPGYTQDDIDDMNLKTLIKIWDKNTGNQLTIQTISYELGVIVLQSSDELDPLNYNIMIQYQYYIDRIIEGKYRWYQYDLNKTGANIEYPQIIASDTNGNDIAYSYESSSETLYLSDWEILNGNNRIKFKLSNNVTGSGIARISKFEVWGNSLECVNPLMFESIDGETIAEYENVYEITNDYILNIEFGKRLVDYYLFKYKSNLSFLTADCKFVPQVDLMDRVSVNESVSGIDFDFLIISIRHSLKINENWKTILTLESLIPPWTFDEDRVDSLSYKLGLNVLSFYSYSTPPTPTNLLTTESTFLQTSGEVITRINVSFTVPAYSYYSHSFIQYSNDNGVTWKDHGNTVIGKAFIPNVVVGNTYLVRVQTVSLNGLTSDWVTSSPPLTIVGKDTPPSDISAYYLIQTGSTIKVNVEPLPDPDIRNYELRLGGSWENSVLIKTFNDVQTTFDITQEGVKTFWMKAVDNSGNYSTNAKRVVLSVYGLPIKNVISETTPDLSTWETTGVYRCPWTGCYLINSDQIIDDGEYFADIFEGGHTLRDDASVILPAVDLGGDILEESYFYVDPWGFIQLETVEKVQDYPLFFDMFDVLSFTYVSPQYKVETFVNVVLDYLQTSNNFVNIYYRTSIEGEVWSDWVALINHQFFGRYIQLRLDLGSLDEVTNVNLCGATILIDVPTIIDILENIAVAGTGTTTINYNQQFYQTPSSILPVVKDSSNRMAVWQIDNITKTSFDLSIYDFAGNQVSGTLVRADVKGF